MNEHSLYEAYNKAANITEASSIVKSQVDLIVKYAKKLGIRVTTKELTGFTSVVFPQKNYIVVDGVGLIAKKSNGDEIEYFDTPKLNYKKAVQAVGSIKESEENLDEASATKIKVNSDISLEVYKSSESILIKAGNMDLPIHKTEISDFITALKKAEKAL